MKQKPDIKKRVFWDVNYEEIDFENDRFYVINRVMNFGIWSDFLAILKYYDLEIIREEIVKTTYLKKDVFNFICFYFELKPEQFKCFNYRQSNLEHLNF